MKIIVIGSGLIGISTAYFLSRQGHNVIVLDRQEGPALETSYANGGMATPSQSEPWNSPGIYKDLLTYLGDEDSPFLLRPRAIFSIIGWGMGFLRNASPARFHTNMLKNVRLANYSLNILKNLRRTLEIHYDETSSGTLKYYKSNSQWKRAIEHSRFYEEMGVSYRLLNSDEVLEVEPALQNIEKKIVGGIYFPEDESGDAHKFCLALAAHAKKNGAEFKYGITVLIIEYAAGEITEILTSDGQYKADAYVLAAGSYSTMLAKAVNINLPIRPVKGYSLTLDLSGWVKAPKIPIVDETMHAAVTPMGGRLRVAGTAEINGYDTEINELRIKTMFKFVTGLFPDDMANIDKDTVTTWAGLRPYSVDGVPTISQTSYSNLFLNTGHGHLGWTMSAGSGQLLADLINENETAIDLSPYSLGR